MSHGDEVAVGIRFDAETEERRVTPRCSLVTRTPGSGRKPSHPWSDAQNTASTGRRCPEVGQQSRAPPSCRCKRCHRPRALCPTTRRSRHRARRHWISSRAAARCQSSVEFHRAAARRVRCRSTAAAARRVRCRSTAAAARRVRCRSTAAARRVRCRSTTTARATRSTQRRAPSAASGENQEYGTQLSNLVDRHTGSSPWYDGLITLSSSAGPDGRHRTSRPTQKRAGSRSLPLFGYQDKMRDASSFAAAACPSRTSASIRTKRTSG